MAYLTSFKSSMPCQHWWPSKRKRRVGVSSFYCGATCRNTLSAGTSFSGLEGTLRGKDPDQRNFKSSLFERLRKAVNNAAFIVTGINECKSSSSTSHLLEEQQDRSSDLMDDLFDQTAKHSSLFFSSWRRCKCRCAASDKALSKKPAKHCWNPAKILFPGRSPRRWITPDILPIQQLRVRLGDLYNQRHR